MRVTLAVVFLLLCAAVRASEVLLTIDFDIASDQDSKESSAATTVEAYLNSPHLKWLRYFHVSLAGVAGRVPMRVAHLLFKDVASWAAFEGEFAEHTHALLDNHWLNSRRSLWEVQPNSIAYPAKERNEETKGGYLFVFQYSVAPGKEADYASQTHKVLSVFATELGDNEGFVEAKEYSADRFQSSLSRMTIYEFNTLPALVKAVYGDLYSSLTPVFKQYLADYSVTILAPGQDSGLFWMGEGAESEVRQAEL